MQAKADPGQHTEPRRIKIIRAPSFSLRALAADVADLAHYRDLLYTLTLHRINVRYKQSVLGWAWALLQPLALMAIYTVIFSLVTRIPTNGTPYAVFVYAALLPWTFFATSITNSAGGFLAHTQLITKVYFPREIIPITYVFAALFDLLIAAAVLAGMMIWYRIPLTPHALFAIPVLMVELIFASGLSVLLAALQVRFRDVGLAIPLVIQVWMFATPVVYPLSAVPARFRSVYIMNPMTGIVENFRRAVIEGIGPDLASFWYSVGIAALLFPLAFLFFKNREATMADVI
jgi:lipopolysaccharide transport system permease protein